jgi:hypothetical protein
MKIYLFIKKTLKMDRNLIYFIFHIIEADDIVSLNELKTHIKDFSLLLLLLNHKDNMNNTIKKHFNHLVDIYVEIDELIKNNILHIYLDKNKIEINKDSVVYSEFVNDKTKILNIMSFIENTENDNEDDESSEDDESFEEDDDDDESSEEDDDNLDVNSQYYIVKSFSNDDNYFVRTDLKKCSCKAFEYCSSDIPTCKHIKLLEKCSEEELLSYPKTE